jgi:hypothetical protein
MEPNSPLKKEAAVKIADHGREAGHWYDEHANLIEEVAKADGKGMTKCTLRQARKLQLARGCTSVIELSAKPGLVNWQIDQAILSALTFPRPETMSEHDFLVEVKKDCKKQAKEAAEEGTRVHAALQFAIQQRTVPPAYTTHVEGMLARMDALCGVQAWRSEVNFVSPFGYGCKLDLISDEWILDLKGKDGTQAELDALELYDEHAMQLASQLEAGCGSQRCGILFFSRNHHGAARIVEVPHDDLLNGFNMFRGLLAYSFAKDNYRPKWASETP